MLALAAVASAAGGKVRMRTRYQVPLPGISDVMTKAPWAAYFFANMSASRRSGNELSCSVNFPFAAAAAAAAASPAGAAGTLASDGALTTIGADGLAAAGG